MALNFAPYEPASPETHRALSPPPARTSSPPIIRRAFSPTSSSSYQNPAPAGPARIASPPPWNYAWADGANDIESGSGRGSARSGGRAELNEFETSLPLRLDYEACLAYLLLPPAGGVLLLVLEWKSDYVRFHAWQSALLFSAMFVLHLIFAWSSFLSWLLLLADLGMIGYLTLKAYQDAGTLDRYEVPIFGPLASRFLDDE